LRYATLVRNRFQRGQVSEAEVSVLDDFDLIETTAFHESFLQAFLVLIRAAKARGDTARAIDFVNRAERLGWERGWRHVVAASLLERVRLLLAMGKRDDAQSLLEAYEQLRAPQAVKKPNFLGLLTAVPSCGRRCPPIGGL